MKKRLYPGKQTSFVWSSQSMFCTILFWTNNTDDSGLLCFENSILGRSFTCTDVLDWWKARFWAGKHFCPEWRSCVWYLISCMYVHLDTRMCFTWAGYRSVFVFEQAHAGIVVLAEERTHWWFHCYILNLTLQLLCFIRAQAFLSFLRLYLESSSVAIYRFAAKLLSDEIELVQVYLQQGWYI